MAPLAPTTAVSGDKVIIDWNAPSSNGGSSLMSYSVFIRGFDLQYVLETNYCTGATVLAESKCTIPFTTLRSSLFNLILGNSVMVQVVASNTYGDSAPSPAGSGAVI